jgi:hypothetical protein
LEDLVLKVGGSQWWRPARRASATGRVGGWVDVRGGIEYFGEE